MNHADIPKRSRIINILRNTVIIVGSIVIMLVATRIPHAFQQQKAEQVISELEHIKITIDDVRGTNLPPVPDEVENNKTVAGVDINKNYIRDDVEQYIHTTYPNSERMRAVLLQYAQALQLQLLVPTGNSEIWVAVVQREVEANNCQIMYGELSKAAGKDRDDYYSRVENDFMSIKKLAFNTPIRKQQLDQFNKSIKSYSLSSGACVLIYDQFKN
jgi:hypothetical protein